MEATAIAEVAAIGAGTGLAVYCFSWAVHVWRARNAKLRQHRAAGPLVTIARRAAVLLLLAGMLGMGLSAAWHLVVRHEGLLSGEGLFTARRLADLDVAAVAGGDRVKSGAVLVRYDSPEAEAEIAVLQLRRQSLDAEKQVLLHQPLAVDPEIVEKSAEAHAQERTLRTNLNDLVLEKERLAREALRERLAKEDEIKKLQIAIGQLDGELKRAESALSLSRDDLRRSEALRQRRVITEQEHAGKTNEFTSRQIEVRSLDEQLRRVSEQHAELTEGLKAFLVLSEQQEKSLARDIAALENRLEAVAAEKQELDQRRAADLDRARRHRDESLRKTEVELQQTEQQLAAARHKLEVRSPFAGTVVYRATSPGSVAPEQPLVVLSPADGLRLSVRLPRWMESSVEGAGGITCELLEDLDRDEQRRFVERRFSASLVRWKDLPAQPGYGVAELKCELPAEAVRQLASGEQIAAGLVWRPPLYRAPAFMLSALVAALGGLAWTASLRYSRHTAIATVPVHTPVPPEDPVALEFGAEGAMLRTLGAQLRHMLLRGQLDPHAVAAAEWALDRHRARAGRLLALGLGSGSELDDCLDNFVKEFVERHDLRSDRDTQAACDLLRRLVDVINAALPIGSHDRSRRLRRALLRHEATGPNGHGRHAEPVDQEA